MKRGPTYRTSRTEGTPGLQWINPPKASGLDLPPAGPQDSAPSCGPENPPVGEVHSVYTGLQVFGVLSLVVELFSISGHFSPIVHFSCSLNRWVLFHSSEYRNPCSRLYAWFSINLTVLCRRAGAQLANRAAWSRAVPDIIGYACA